MTIVKRIYIIRHGERVDHVHPEWKKTAAIPYDPPLTDAGVYMAQKCGEALLHDITRVLNINQSEISSHVMMVSSPFLRCLTTSQQIATSLSIKYGIEPGTSSTFHMI